MGSQEEDRVGKSRSVKLITGEPGGVERRVVHNQYSLPASLVKLDGNAISLCNLESLVYAYDLNGDRRFIDAGIPALCHALEWIKNPDEEVHANFRFMAIAHELGILEKVPGAADWLV